MKQRKRGHLRSPAGCGLILGACMLLCSCNLQSGDPPKTTDKSAPSVRGTVAAPFELFDLEGESTRLQDFKGKVVLLNFWGTTCGPCLIEIPWLVAFQKQYASRGFQVVAVSMYGEGPEILKPFVTKHGMQEFKTVMGNQEVMTKFGLVGFPTTLIVDRDGKYYSRHEGLIDRALVEKELEAVLGPP
jgi:thiol-disulfide isomerase/thioredoxin